MSEIREALGYVNQIIDSNFERLPNLKRAYGKIKSIMSNNAKVLVEILSTEEEEKNRELWFLNKTGEILAEEIRFSEKNGVVYAISDCTLLENIAVEVPMGGAE